MNVVTMDVIENLLGRRVMRSNVYRKIVIDHMTTYKKNFLGITTKGIYKDSGIDYGYILPKFNNENYIPIYNLLPTIDTTDYRLQSQNMKYHQYAHHLNSSQLMCINFFLPIIDNSILLNILKAININISADTKIEEAEFEKIIPYKDNTNFDFYLKLSTGEKIYFEIKYTEQGFGGSCFDKGSLKAKYDEKYNKYYAKELITSKTGVIEKEEFFKNYQINRNLVYIKDSNDYVVFILPFDSEDLLKEVTTVTAKYTNIKKQIKIVDWTDLCDIALEESKNTVLYQHFRLFKDKYIV